MLLHAHAIAEDRAATERARGVYRQHANFVTVLADAGHELIGECGLPGSGRAGDADEIRTAGERVERSKRRVGIGTTGLDNRDQAGDRAAVTGSGERDEGVGLLSRRRRPR